jgi:phosphate transport system substrate-binding protein
MNDEFLHALRRDPPPEFGRDLQRRLQRQSAPRSVRFWTVRTMLAALLIGGVAVAAALLMHDRDEPRSDDAPIAQAPVPRPPERVAQPDGAPQPGSPIASNQRVPPPQAQEVEAKDIPVTVLTSSLPRPLAQALVERLGKSGYFAQPRLRVSDHDEAFRTLCGSDIDFVIASRRIADAELAQCHKWGIPVLEWKLGYQAVVLAAAPTTELTALSPRDVFLALARRIPDPAEPSQLIDNPNTAWSDVDARFAYRSIDIFAPPDATTRAAFVELVMEPGCESFPWIRRLRQTDRARYNEICHQLRTDGRYREIELTNTLVTQRLWAEPNWLVILGYRYYQDYRTQLRTMLEGPAPTLATLTDGTYPAARPVYVYAQRSHLDWNPGARLLAQELRHVYSVGQRGYLSLHGLVPLDDLPDRMRRFREALPPPLESLQP